MDRITRKQRQLERKYDNLRRIAAEEQRSGSRGLATSLSGQLRSGSGQAHNKGLLPRTPSSSDARSSSGDPIKRYHQNQQQQQQKTDAMPAMEQHRSLSVFIAIQAYVPEPGKAPEEALPLEQGQIVEVLDNKNAAHWLAQPPQTGWVPGSYFETPSKYYTQQKNTRELAADKRNLSEQQQALLKREQVFHELLCTEEAFAAQLRNCLQHYLEAFDAAPEEVREHRQQLTLNMRELCNFHTNVMLNGLQYYSDDPGNVGQTFLRLERDFEQHIATMREVENAQRIIAENSAVQTFLEAIYKSLPIHKMFKNVKSTAGSELKEYIYYLELIPNRIRQYEDYFKEIIKYSMRIQQQQNANMMQKALELIQSLPIRAQEIEFTKNLLDYPEDIGQLGRIYRHELFNVWEDDVQESAERYIFLFRNKMMLTDRDMKSYPPVFRHYSTMRLDKYTVRQHSREEDTMVFRPEEPGLPTFLVKSVHSDAQSREFVRKAWLRDIVDMQAAIGGSTEEENVEEG
uniref:DH domain-containing protein n=1 Tax=Globodera pallida TaxID=36090 RepID=A0A183BTN9_GLOPA